MISGRKNLLNWVNVHSNSSKLELNSTLFPIFLASLTKSKPTLNGVYVFALGEWIHINELSSHSFRLVRCFYYDSCSCCIFFLAFLLWSNADTKMKINKVKIDGKSKYTVNQIIFIQLNRERLTGNAMNHTYPILFDEQ